MRELHRLVGWTTCEFLLIPVAKVQGRAIVTIEGLGRNKFASLVQERLADMAVLSVVLFAWFVMSATALYVTVHMQAEERSSKVSWQFMPLYRKCKDIAAVESLMEHDPYSEATDEQNPIRTNELERKSKQKSLKVPDRDVQFGAVEEHGPHPGRYRFL